MVGQNPDLLALAMQECLPHRPTADNLAKLRGQLAVVIKKIEVLKEEEEELRDQADATEKEALREADAIYALLTRTSGNQQDELLAAILYVKAELERIPEEDVAAMREQATALLATPANTPVLYQVHGMWYGNRTADMPYLRWDGDEWWLQLPLSGSRATAVPLEALRSPLVPSPHHDVRVGADQIRAVLDSMQPAERQAKRDQLRLACVAAGLTGIIRI